MLASRVRTSGRQDRPGEPPRLNALRHPGECALSVGDGSRVGVRPRSRCLTRGTPAFAVTGFVIAEICGDQLRVNMGGDHSVLSAECRDASLFGELSLPSTPTVWIFGLSHQGNKSRHASGTKTSVSRTAPPTLARQCPKNQIGPGQDLFQEQVRPTTSGEYPARPARQPRIRGSGTS
jgi:hypothetical protein